MIELLSLIGTGILRYGLVLILIAFGALKWTRGEADSIQPMVSHSPFMSWMYRLLSVQAASIAVGVVELVLAVMIATRRVFPLISGWGSALAIAMFAITLSFLFTTPHLDPGTQSFLIKDIFLLGAAVYLAGEAFRAAALRQRSV